MGFNPVGFVTGAIEGFVRGGPISAIGGAVRGSGLFGEEGLDVVPGKTTALKKRKMQGLGGARLLAGNGENGCPEGYRRTRGGGCEPSGVGIGGYSVDPGAIAPGGDPFIVRTEQGYGDAVLGRYGPGLEPGIRESSTRLCPRGTVLGLDGLCYDKGAISNRQRWWPRGRRPLLTGGEMRAISTAATAAKKLQRTEKRLQQLGMLKKPTRRARALPAAHHRHVHHD